MDPLIELTDGAKARIQTKEAKAAEQFDIVRRACDADVAKARRTWGGYFDLHQNELQDAIDEARRLLDEAAVICARYVFEAHAAEYAIVLRDPRGPKPVLAMLREAIVKQYGERTRMAIQFQEAVWMKNASAEEEWPGSGQAMLSLRKPDGAVFERIAAEFSAEAILVWDVAHSIEQGDMLIRTLSSGLRVGLIVDDPGYREALGSIRAHFEVRAHHAARMDSLESSGFWRTRRTEFEELSHRQRNALDIDRKHPRWLRGFCSRIQEYAGKLAYCDVEGGLDAELQSKFEDVATQAAIALGCPPDRNPVKFWLSCLCLDLLQNSLGPSTELLQSVPEGGFIVDLLGSSAAFCSRLAAMAERQASDARFKSARSPDAAVGREGVAPPAESESEEDVARFEPSNKMGAPVPQLQQQTKHLERIPLSDELKNVEARTADSKLQKKAAAVVRYTRYFDDLKVLKAACRRYQTPTLLEQQFHNLDVWAALDIADKTDIAKGEFEPGAFAWALVKRFLNLTGKDDRTLKNYRKALKAAGLL